MFKSYTCHEQINMLRIFSPPYILHSKQGQYHNDKWNTYPQGSWSRQCINISYCILYEPRSPPMFWYIYICVSILIHILSSLSSLCQQCPFHEADCRHVFYHVNVFITSAKWNHVVIEINTLSAKRSRSVVPLMNGFVLVYLKLASQTLNKSHVAPY